MKRILGLLTLMSVLVVPVSGFAAGEQVGVYVAPKFVYGLVQTEGTKGHWTESGSTYTGTENVGSKTDSTFGGSLAIGYDFDKKFNIPVRAEIEYAVFSKAKIDKTFSEGDYSSKVEQSFGIQTLFANAYWDINTGTKFTPYVGAGLGMAFINTKYTDKGADGGSVQNFSHFP